MSKLMIAVIAFYVAFAVSAGYLIYLGVGAIQEHGLKDITEQIWYGESGEELEE